VISFIIIGKNEARTIKKTIDSIYVYIHFNKISAYEIIYVDSKSTDDSINIVKSFNEIKIYEVIGETNAAIGRNIGAKEAKGDVFIFLDADMEIKKTFHNVIFKNGKLIYPFVSGQLKNIFYNSKWKVVDENFLFPNLKEDNYTAITGGYFVIEKNLWNSVHGMKTKYTHSEDFDLGLRLAKKGILLLRKKELFVTHHTIHYQNKARMWKMLFDGLLIYQTSVLYRDHIFNKYIYKKMLRMDYTFLILLISIGGTYFSIYVLLIHPISVILRVLLMKKIKQNVSIGELICHRYLIDLFSFFGLFLFFPQQKKIIYKKVNQ